VAAEQLNLYNVKGKRDVKQWD